MFSRENFEKLKMADIEKWLSPILKKSYMEISIVGDVDEKEAVGLAARTFGALPPREAENPAARAELEFVPAGPKISETYKTTDEPRSLALMVWLTSDKSQMKKMRADNILGEILDDVLRKEIREAEGKVYSPFAYNNSSAWIKGVGFMTAATFVVPEYNAEMLERFGECAQRVMNSISEDEFERAKTPLLKSVEANKRKNVYWLEAVLNMSQCRPENIKLAETIESGYAEVSLEDVRSRAEEIFSKTPYSADVMPANDKKVLKK